MKKSILFLLGSMMLLSIASCEKDLPVYEDSQAYLDFKYNSSKTDSLMNYSFVFSGGKSKDTVWVTLVTEGFVSNQNRSFELKQVATGDHDAVPGKHYVDLASDSMKAYCVVPAGATTVKVPILVLKDDSESECAYNLRIEVKDNGTFKPGYKEQSYKLISISNVLSKPDAWGGAMNYYFGTWGPVKHQFMIDITGEKWDDEFINANVYDYGYVSYTISKLDKALAEENAKREAAGQPYLQEADGTLVAFGW